MTAIIASEDTYRMFWGTDDPLAIYRRYWTETGGAYDGTALWEWVADYSPNPKYMRNGGAVVAEEIARQLREDAASIAVLTAQKCPEGWSGVDDVARVAYDPTEAAYTVFGEDDFVCTMHCLCPADLNEIALELVSVWEDNEPC